MTPNEYDFTGKVIKEALAVHSTLGPGLLESAYKECLYYKLTQSGLLVQKEIPIPLKMDGVKLECGYRIDLLVERNLVIEVKSVDALNELHLAQILTYMRLMECRLGLLFNFNVVHLKDGIRRVINSRIAA